MMIPNMTATNYVDATFWVQVQPEWYPWKKAQEDVDAVCGAKVVAMTQTRPQKPRSGTVLTKLTIRIPKGAFLPLVPEAVIMVPEELLQVNQIEVEAQDANNV